MLSIDNRAVSDTWFIDNFTSNIQLHCDHEGKHHILFLMTDYLDVHMVYFVAKKFKNNSLQLTFCNFFFILVHLYYDLDLWP